MPASDITTTNKLDLTHPVSMDLESLLNSKGVPNYLIDLSHMSLIKVGGPDAESFLQGQFSNDLNLLAHGHSQLHAYCNPKGRALAIIRIMRRDDNFWMAVPKNISEALIKRLKMFVMRVKVDIQLDLEQLLLGWAGDDSKLDIDGFHYRIDPGQINTMPARYLVISKQHQTPVFHSDLWRWLDIQSGIPQVYEQTQEAFIPQMVNLDLVEGINFKKGCYPGQEIIARIKYLGKLKQRMIIASIKTDITISPGDGIFNPTKPEQKSGIVVDAVKTGEDQFCLSATVPSIMAESGEIRVISANGPELHRTKLPYLII